MGAPKDLADLAQRFDADRRHLTSVAFHLLGSVADADDAVQSAWLKASRSDFDSIKNVANLTGWFTTITAHEAVDQLRVRRRRAEQPLTDLNELDRLALTASRRVRCAIRYDRGPVGPVARGREEARQPGQAPTACRDPRRTPPPRRAPRDRRSVSGGVAWG